MIDLYIIYGSLFAILFVLIGQYLVQQNKFSVQEKFIYLFLIFSILGWVTANAISDIVKIHAIAQLAAETAILFAPNIATSVYLVSKILPQSINTTGYGLAKNRSVVLIILVSTIITLTSLILLTSPLNIQNFVVNINTASSFEPGPLYTLVLGYAFIIMIITIVQWLGNLRYNTWLQQQQVLILVYSLAIILFSLISGFVIFPILGITHLTPLSFISILFYLYLIQNNFSVKYTIFNISQTISLFILNIGISFALLGLLNLYIHISKQQVTFIPMFLLVFLTYVVFHATTSAVYNSKFFVRDTRKIVSQFIEKNIEITVVDKLFGLLKQTFKQLFPSGTSYIFLIGQHPDNFPIQSVENISRLKFSVVTREILIYIHSQTTSFTHSKAYLQLDNFMKTHGIDLIIPFYKERQLTAIAYVTESKATVTRELLDQLELLQHNTSIALSRCLLYERTVNFAEELKVKVQESTKDLQEANKVVEIKNKQLKSAFDELKTLDNAKSEFISIASHQLRTPISIIKGYLSMIVEGDFGATTDEQLGALKKTVDNIQQLNDIVEDILNASRIERGKLLITPEQTDLIELITNVTEQLKNKANTKKLSLTLNNSIETYPISADRNKIYEVIMNLIDNAINYTKEGGITVATKIDPADKEAIIVSVSDTGIGIPEEFRDKIFKRFSRSENARQIRPDGTGIGLYVIKSFVEAHKGQIWFESVLNQGTTFYVKLLKKPVFDFEGGITKETKPKKTKKK